MYLPSINHLITWQEISDTWLAVPKRAVLTALCVDIEQFSYHNVDKTEEIAL